MAAEGYARVTNTPAIVNVTTGPGGLNALNGVFGAYTDSIPMIVVSGQVKRETCMASYNLPDLRQLGDQEADLVCMVRGITKYAVLVTDPRTIRYHLERAWHLAISGRPGPCWIDIPIDVQSSKIEPDELPGATTRPRTVQPGTSRSSRHQSLRPSAGSVGDVGTASIDGRHRHPSGRGHTGLPHVDRTPGHSRDHGVDGPRFDAVGSPALLRPSGQHRRPCG